MARLKAVSDLSCCWAWLQPCLTRTGRWWLELWAFPSLVFSSHDCPFVRTPLPLSLVHGGSPWSGLYLCCRVCTRLGALWLSQIASAAWAIFFLRGRERLAFGVSSERTPGPRSPSDTGQLQGDPHVEFIFGGGWGVSLCQWRLRALLHSGDGNDASPGFPFGSSRRGLERCTSGQIRDPLARPRPTTTPLLCPWRLLVRRPRCRVRRIL